MTHSPLYELISGLAGLAMLAAGLWLYRRRLQGEARRWLWPAAAAHAGGSLLFALAHFVWLREGDVMQYYDAVSLLWQRFVENPAEGFRLWLAPVGDPRLPLHFNFSQEAPFLVVRIAFIFSILSGNSLSVMSLGFAALAFAGLWRLWRRWAEAWPGSSVEAALLLLFWPGILLWGGGLSKEALGLALVAWVFASLTELLVLQRRSWAALAGLAAGIWLLCILRNYMGFALAPAFALIMAWWFWGKIPGTGLKTAAAITAIIFLTWLWYKAAGVLSANLSWHSWMMSQATSHAGYELGELAPNGWSLLGKTPAAVFTTLLRPWPWEWRYPRLALAGAEGLLTLAAFAWLSWRGALRRGWLQPMRWALLAYALSAALITGLAAQNFGALTRYRVLVVPFFLLAFTVYNLSSGNGKTTEAVSK